MRRSPSPPKTETLWAVYEGDVGLMLYTLCFTRREAINEYCGSNPEVWRRRKRDWHKASCRRVTVTPKE